MYQLIDGSHGVLREDGTFVPNDPGNTDWLDYLAWLSDGNAPTPAPAPVTPIPTQITRRQCAKQMLIMGLITPIEALAMTKSGDCPAMVMALINQLPAEVQIPAQIDFAAETYLRSNQLLEALMAAAGHDSASVDQFFLAASVL